MTLPVVILAAGESRRLGQPKQLVRYNGETLLARAMRLARESGAAPVLVVLGAAFEVICATVRTDDAILIHNDRWSQGIASSIHAGLGALEVVTPQCAGVLLMTCDQPRLSAAHLRALLEVFESAAQPSIIASTYSGVLGVPAVFPRSAFKQLLALCGDQGARKLIAIPPCPVVAVEFAGGELDIDSPEDLAQLQSE